MISVNSNIKEFLANYRKKAEKFTVFLNNVAQKLADKMVEFMRQEIVAKKNVWYEYGSYIDIPDVGFNIIPIDDKTIKVEIGNNLPLLEMNDGTMVNPAFFIEFGFGIIGQNNPMKNNELYNWEYNINKHTKGWAFLGRDGKFYGSKGKEGINFMYNAQQNAKRFLSQIIEETNV